MTDVLRMDQAGQAQPWNGVLLKGFADSLGVSLDELRKEYDDMIRAFELQKSQLRNFVPHEGVLAEERSMRAPSPTPSDTSINSLKKKKKRPLSTAGIQSSFRSARNTLRRKISGRNPTDTTLPRKVDHGSASSLPHNSESSSLEQEHDVSSK